MRALPLCLVVSAWPALAAAGGGECAAAGGPWVLVQPADDLAPLIAAEAILTDLRTELALHGIAVCGTSDAPPTPPLALVEMAVAGPKRLTTEAEAGRQGAIISGRYTPVGVRIAVVDQVTDKRLERVVDLSRVAIDAGPLALAVAADELLRASWAELALATAPEPPQPVPPEVQAVVESSLAAGAAARGDVIGAAVAEQYLGGQTLFGVEVGGRGWLWPWLGWQLCAGGRVAPMITAPNGWIRARAATGAAAAMLPLIERGQRLELELGLGARAAYIWLDALPRAGATAKAESGMTVQAEASASASLALTARLRLAAMVGLGAPLRRLRANDGDQAAARFDGWLLTGGLGLRAAM